MRNPWVSRTHSWSSAEGTGIASIEAIAHNECTAIDDALRLLGSDKESDALLDVLHMYSEELLDSESIESKDSEECDGDECEHMSIADNTSQLESIENLMINDDHVYHKLRSTNSPFNYNVNSITNIDNKYQLNPLSPFSCNSDSGYESVPSPTLSLEEEIIESSNVCLDHSFTELFPDLV